jgi:hypothetical protein
MASTDVPPRQKTNNDFLEGLLDSLESMEDILEDDSAVDFFLKLLGEDDYKECGIDVGGRPHYTDYFSNHDKQIIQRMYPVAVNNSNRKESLLRYIDAVAPAAELTNVFDEHPRPLNKTEQHFPNLILMERFSASMKRTQETRAFIIPQKDSIGRIKQCQ